jgi:hypothetical protein
VVKEPKGAPVTYNDREYLVAGLMVYVRRYRGEKAWWHRLYSQGATAVAVRSHFNRKDK